MILYDDVMMNRLIIIALFMLGCWQASAQNYLQLANECFDKGDYECAKQNYNLYQIFEGKDMKAEIQKADECFRDLIAADAYFSDLEYEKARDRYTILLEKNPKDPHAQKRLDECEALLKPPVVEPEPVEEVAIIEVVEVIEPEPEVLPVPQPVQQDALPKRSDYRKNVFGIDWGVGTRNLSTGNLGSYNLGAFVDFGVRFTSNFSPYLGWDIVNLKFQGLNREYLVQAMTGLRGYSPALVNNVKGYASFKGGYGKLFTLDDSGFAYELEAGLHVTKTFAAGFVFNVQTLTGSFSDESSSFNSRYIGLRIGLNF